MRHLFSYEIRNQPTALQYLKQELDSTLSSELKGIDFVLRSCWSSMSWCRTF